MNIADRIMLQIAAFADCDIADAVNAAARLGISTIDLQADTTTQLGQSTFRTSEAGYKNLRDLLESNGLAAGCVSNVRDCQLLLGPYGENTAAIVSGDADQCVQHAKDAAKRTFDLANALHAKDVRFFLGCPDYARWFHWHGANTSWRTNVEQLAEVLIPLLDDAALRGLTLSLEPHPKQVLTSVPSINLLIDLIDHRDNLGICYDPANIRASGCDPYQFLENLTTAPRFVHMKDVEIDKTGMRQPGVNGWTTLGPQPCARFRAMGWGELDWKRLLSILSDKQYEGPFVIEHEDVLIDRELGIANTRDLLHELLIINTAKQRWW